MSTKPILETVFHLTGMNHEPYEYYGEVDSEEKERSNDCGEEDLDIYFSSVRDSELHIYHNLSWFTFQMNLIDSHLDIPLPPPKQS